MARIQFDYNGAISQARKLESIAEELKTLARSRLQNCVDSVKSSWEGDSARLYIQKCSETKESLLKTARELEANAQQIRRKADEMRRAEEEAKRAVITIANRS